MKHASGAALANNVKAPLLELWNFLKNPRLIDTQRHWDRRVWTSLAILMLFEACLAVPLTWLLVGYDSFIENALSRNIPAYTAFDGETFFESILLGVFLAPLLEEPMFRGWLTGKWKHFAIGSLWIVWLSAASVTVLFFDESEVVDATISISFLVLVALSAVIYITTRHHHQLAPKLVEKFPIFFWTSVVSFGLLHVANYEYDNYWLVIPYVIPQLTAGALWGYARINYGLKASILLHAISNLWITCLYHWPWM